MRGYSETLELVEMVPDEAAAGDSTAGKGVLGITHLHSILLLKVEK